jgi:hypothetical protein
MGFFSNIKNRARGMANDLGPSNMPMQELRAGQIMPNSPQLDRRLISFKNASTSSSF